MTVPAQNSWFFKTWLARRRTVQGGQLVTTSSSPSSRPAITRLSSSSAYVQQRQIVHRVPPDRLGQLTGTGAPERTQNRLRKRHDAPRSDRRCQTEPDEPGGEARQPAAVRHDPRRARRGGCPSSPALVRTRQLVTLSGVGGRRQDPARPRGRRGTCRGVPGRRVAGRAGPGRATPTPCPTRSPTPSASRRRASPRHRHGRRGSGRSARCSSWSTTASTSSRRPRRRSARSSPAPTSRGSWRRRASTSASPARRSGPCRRWLSTAA